MAKGKRKVTLENPKPSSSNNSNNDGTPPRRPSVFERLGPGSSGSNKSTHKSGSNEPRDKGRTWNRADGQQFGNGNRYPHPSVPVTGTSSKPNKKKVRDKNEDSRGKISGHQLDVVENKDGTSQSDSPNIKKTRVLNRKKEPEAKIKSQVVVTNRKVPSSGRNDDRSVGHANEEWENETGNRGKMGDWRIEKMDRSQLDFEEELLLEKKRQQLQRELELEMQKERLLKHGHESVIIQKRAVSSSSSNTSSSNSSSSSSSSSSDGEDSSSSSSSGSSSSERKNSSKKTKKMNSSNSSSSSDDASNRHRRLLDERKTKRDVNNQKTRPANDHSQGRRRDEAVSQSKKGSSPNNTGAQKLQQSQSSSQNVSSRSRQRQSSGQDKSIDKHHKKKKPPNIPPSQETSISKPVHRSINQSVVNVSDSRSAKKSPVKRKLPYDAQESKKSQHKVSALSTSKIDVKKPVDNQTRTKSRSPKREGIPMHYYSSDNEKDFGNGQGHSHSRSMSNERGRTFKNPVSPSSSSGPHSLGQYPPGEPPERSSRKIKHLQPTMRKVTGVAASEVHSAASGKKAKDRDRLKEVDRPSKEYERTGRRSPPHISDTKRPPPLPPQIRPRASPPLRSEKQGRSREESRGSDCQWQHSGAGESHDSWSTASHSDRGRFNEVRGPHSPPRKDRDGGRRLKYDDPGHQVTCRQQLHDTVSDRSRDPTRRPMESSDDRYGRRETQGRLLPDVRQPLMGRTHSKSPEPRGMPDDRSGRGPRQTERDRRVRPADDNMHLVIPDLMMDRRRPPSPSQDSKYHAHHRKMTPPCVPPAPPSPLPSLMHHPIVPGRYPSPLEWQQDKGRRGATTYSPERRKAHPSSPTRHDVRYDHHEYDDSIDVYDYGRRERSGREHPQPLPPLQPLGRHLIDKGPRQDRYQNLRGSTDPVEGYDRESSRSRQDYGHDDQRNIDLNRHPDKWDNRRDAHDNQRGHLRSETDHPQHLREAIGRRREEELPPNRKRVRDEPPEKIPITKRRKGHSPGPSSTTHDHSHPQDVDIWNRNLTTTESSRRLGGTKPQAPSETSGTQAARNSIARDKTVRHSGDPKDVRLPPRISKTEVGEKEQHQSKRPIKDTKVGSNIEPQTKPDLTVQKRKRPAVPEPDRKIDKRKKPDEVTKSKDTEVKKPKVTPPDISGSVPTVGNDEASDSKVVEKPPEPETSLQSRDNVVENVTKPISTTLDLGAESFSDLSDDSLDLLNQNESPPAVDVESVTKPTIPENEPKQSTPPLPSSLPSLLQLDVVAPVAILPLLSAVNEEKRAEECLKMTTTAAVASSKLPSKRHKARSEGGDDSRGSFDDFGGRGRSKDRSRLREKTGHSSHPSSRHTSLDRSHMYHPSDKEHSRTSTPVRQSPQSTKSASLPVPEQRIEEKKQQIIQQQTPVPDSVVEPVAASKGDAGSEKTLGSNDNEYDPISDDELEALLEEPADKEGGKMLDSQENRPVGIIDALEVDWASLIGDKAKRPECGPKNALQNFSPARVLARIGVSASYAGPALMNRIRQVLNDEAQAEKALFNQSAVEGESNQSDDAKDQKNLASKFQLEHDIAAFHTAMLMQKRERDSVLDNIGPYRQALCARRDLQMRRKLSRLRIKNQENTSPLLTSPNVDHEMLRLSLQLFRQHKVDALQPLSNRAIACL